MSKMHQTVKKNSWILIALVAVLMFAIGGVAAKYMTQREGEQQHVAAGFYISADYLEEISGTSSTVNHTATDISTGIQVRLYNYQKENVALISEMDMRCKVTVSDGWSVSITKNGTPVTISDGHFVMSKSDSRETYLLQITPQTDAANPLTVTVETVSPYRVTLGANFTIVEERNPAFSLVEYENHVVLEVKTNGYAGAVKVQWDSDQFSPDNTNRYMENWIDRAAGQVSSGEFVAAKYQVYELIFVKRAAEDFGKTNTAKITEDNTTTVTLGHK